MAVTINGTTGIETNTDTGKLVVGTGDDFKIFHDGTHTYLDNYTGNIVIRKDNTETFIKMIEDGAVELYHNGVKKFETTSTGVTVSNQGNNRILKLKHTDGDHCYITFMDDDTADDGQVRVGCLNEDLLFLAHAAEKGRFTADGLTFNGDTAAANALNDYEEGSFTVIAYSSGGTQQPLNSSIDAFSYIKIGSMVYIQGRINFASGTPDGTGALKLGGLPFTTSNTLAEQGAMHQIAINTHGIDLPSTTIATFVEFTNNSTWMYAVFQKDNASWAGIDVSYCDNGDYIALSGCYITDS